MNIIDRMTRALHLAQSERQKVHSLVITAHDFKEFLEWAQTSMQQFPTLKYEWNFMGVPILIGSSFQVVYSPSDGGALLWKAAKDDGKMRRVK